MSVALSRALPHQYVVYARAKEVRKNMWKKKRKMRRRKEKDPCRYGLLVECESN
jgi:hypothetical protein